ncbi:unnamed protein product, partial [Amoebophrya sp. A120]|eukprot:GSA120T00021460001.1
MPQINEKRSCFLKWIGIELLIDILILVVQLKLESAIRVALTSSTIDPRSHSSTMTSVTRSLNAAGAEDLLHVLQDSVMLSSTRKGGSSASVVPCDVRTNPTATQQHQPSFCSAEHLLGGGKKSSTRTARAAVDTPSALPSLSKNLGTSTSSSSSSASAAPLSPHGHVSGRGEEDGLQQVKESCEEGGLGSFRINTKSPIIPLGHKNVHSEHLLHREEQKGWTGRVGGGRAGESVGFGKNGSRDRGAEKISGAP